jgi:hypothetical protein
MYNYCEGQFKKYSDLLFCNLLKTSVSLLTIAVLVWFCCTSRLLYVVSINNKRGLGCIHNGNSLEIKKQYQKSLFLLALLLASVFLTLQLNAPSNRLVASGDLGTYVGGTLTSNTTWTVVNSPYVITNTIQIPDNINLTIDPGVTVTMQSASGAMFLINGIIKAHGNVTSKIIFEGNENSDFFKTNHPVAKGYVDLDFCIIRNGQSAFWFDNTGSFNLTNSELSNLSQASYLWYPSQDVFIEYNTFTNTAGIRIGTDDYHSQSLGSVYVKCNAFINNQGYIINNYASYGSSKTFVNNNSFTYTSGIILQVEKTSTTADMDVSQNYWGTSNTSIIDSMIYDKNDDLSCSSYFNYLPILDTPNPDTPIAPTPTPYPTPVPTPTNTPEPTSLPTTTPDPTASPTPLTIPADPTAMPSPLNSLTPDPTFNSTNLAPNQTTNPSNVDTNTHSSTTPPIPEFPISIALLILFVAGSISAVSLKRKIG